MRAYIFSFADHQKQCLIDVIEHNVQCTKALRVYQLTMYKNILGAYFSFWYHFIF